MRRSPLLLALAATAAPVQADPITVTKNATVVSAPVATTVPKSIPGAEVDYTIRLTNPLANAGQPVRNMVFEDAIPASVILRVRDLGAVGSGPVRFTNGPVVLGVGDSGLTYVFRGLGDQTDSIEFWNGQTWTYTPVPDADGYDANVRAIRIKPLTTFSTGGAFSLQFRVKLR